MIDQVATEAMRFRLNNMNFYGEVIIGEGEKDEAPGLFNGERVGKYAFTKDYDPGSLKAPDFQVYDIAVDPIDGTTQTSISGPEAVSVIGVSLGGTMLRTDAYYMEKLVWGPTVERKRKLIDDHDYVLGLHQDLMFNVRFVADALRLPTNNVTVCILDRPRHERAIETLRKNRVKIKLIQDCDVSGAIATCRRNSGVHLLYGIGGGPEAVITACAIKSLRGGMETQECNKDLGWQTTGDIYNTEALVKGPCVFAATGVTDGSILEGVKVRKEEKRKTHSVFMRSESGTERLITAYHGN
jgi:fructose-1,6-bisphosphatase II